MSKGTASIKAMLGRSAAMGALAALALAGGAAPAAAADPIKLGCVAALSGPAADIGNRLREGAELAVAAMSEIKGQPVQLIVRDSKGDPAVAQQQVESLVSDQKIVGLLCVSLSSEGAALSAAARAGRLAVPNIQASAVADDITGKSCNPWTFRTVPSATEIARAVAKYKDSRPDLAEGGWYTLASDYLYGRSSAKAFSEVPGVKLLGETFVPLDTTDWTPYLNKIATSGAKGLWLPVALGAPYIQLMTQANNLRMLERITVVAPTGLPQEFIDQLGENGVGMVEPASAVLMTEPATREVAESYHKARGKAPSEGALQSYVAASIMLQAVRDAAAQTPEGVRDALQKGRFKTIVGDVSFRPGDQQLLAPVWPARVEKLKAPVAGSQYGFVAVARYEAADLLPSVEQTGCRPR